MSFFPPNLIVKVGIPGIQGASFDADPIRAVCMDARDRSEAAAVSAGADAASAGAALAAAETARDAALSARDAALAASSSISIGTPGGVCPLGADSLVPGTYLPLATNEEATAGVVTDKIVAPSALRAALDARPSGGGALTLTLMHTTEVQSTTSATYEDLYVGRVIARRAWHSDRLVLLVQRSGAGQVRATLSDGTHQVQVEVAAFAAVGVDTLALDGGTLDDNAVWTLTLAAKASTGTVTLSRIKATADPVDAMSPPLVASGTGGNTNGTAWAELTAATILPTALQPDGRSGVILSGAVTLTGATGAEIRVTVSGTVGGTTTTTSATGTVTASGVVRLDCAYPAVAAPVMTVRVEGRITAGTGTLALPTWQINLEQ